MPVAGVMETKGQMLGFDFSKSPHLKGVLGDPEQLRNRGWKYLSEFFVESCHQNPVVIFMEDIHWADDSSMDSLSYLVEQLEQDRLLIACAARPTLLERRPYWGEGLAYHQRMELSALSKRSSQELVAEIFKHAEHLPGDLRDLLVESAEGNPFYLEELVKMLIEGGVVKTGEANWSIHLEQLAARQVPPTLAGVLQARLDGLPITEKIILQQASVVGRQFWDRSLVYIQASGEGDPLIVQMILSSLRARELVYRRENSGIRDSREFIFKHDILREVTYESVLKRKRKTYHSLTADWLIAQGAERIDEFSSLIAGHLLRAGRVDRAVEYYLRAGNSALKTFANKEAETSFQEALLHSTGDSQQAAGLAGLGETLRRQGRNDEAIEILRPTLELQIRLGDQDSAARSFTCLSRVLFSQYLDQAWEVCSDGLTRLDKRSDSPGMAQLLAEAGRISFFHLRPPDEVKDLCRQAIEMAGRLGDVEISADTMLTLAQLEMRNNHLEESISISEEVIELAEANNLFRLARRAHNNLGVIYDKLLDPSKYIEHCRQAIETSKKINENFFYSVSNLIEGYVKIGKINEAQRTFDAEFLNTDSPSNWEEKYCSLISRMRIQYARGDWHTALETQEEC